MSSATRLVLLALTIALAGCAGTARNQTALPTPTLTQPPLQTEHDPGQVGGTILGTCHLRHHGRNPLPDPRCTPGAYDPTITAAKLCAPGYRTDTYRPPPSQTEHFKYDIAIPAYGLHITGPTELDHLVPLWLGGSNSAANLWVEPGGIPNPKDAIETKLHFWVCDAPNNQQRELRLGQARRAIAADWTTAEAVLGIVGGKASSPSQSVV